MPLPRVPKDRVVDAAPVALVLILLSLPVPLALPMAMLHLWLWLRHPRSLSRYLIAGFVLLLTPLTLIAQEKRMHEWPAYLIAISATGILPILYRLVSRCSLTYGDANEPTNQESESRGAISDLMSLSFLTALVFIALQAPANYRYEEPFVRLVVALMLSATGLLGMRFAGHRRIVSTFLTTLVLWGIGFSAIRFGNFLMEFAREEYFVGADWLGDEWDIEREYISIFTLLLAFFPPLCRWCGVRLAPPNLQTDQSLITAATRWLPKSWLASPSRALGRLVVLLAISTFTLGPFVHLKESPAGQGYRVAGWPTNYLEQTQFGGTDRPWYWTESDLWETDRFSILGLLTDVAITLAIFLILVPPKRIRDLVPVHAMTIGRLAGVLAIAGFIAWNVYLEDAFRSTRIEQEKTIVVESARERKLELISYFSQQALSLAGIEFQPMDVTAVRVSNASTKTINEIWHLGDLESIAFEDCKLTDRELNRLCRLKRLSEIQFVDCKLPTGFVETCLVDSNAESIVIETPEASSRYELTSSDREFWLELALLVDSELDLHPSVTAVAIDALENASQIVIRSAPAMTHLYVASWSARAQNTPARLELVDVPALQSLALPPDPPVALGIDSAPRLDEIYSEFEGPAIHSLRMDETPPLQYLAVNLDVLKSVQVADPQKLSHLILSGTPTISSTPKARQKQITSAAAALRSVFQCESLHLSSLPLSPEWTTSLPLAEDVWVEDCEIAPDAIVQWAKQNPELKGLTAEAYQPNDETLQSLVTSLPKLRSFSFDATNLTSLPQDFGSGLEVLHVRQLNVDNNELMKLDCRTLEEIQIASTTMTDEVLQQWQSETLSQVSLTGTRVSTEGIAALVQRCPRIADLRVLKVRDDVHHVPSYTRTLVLRGQSIEMKDHRLLTTLGFDLIDIRGCNLSDEVIEAIRGRDRQHDATYFADFDGNYLYPPFRVEDDDLF
ncbi:MAG: hypothetical protein AAFX06_08535 [Planctomycetota bacterium]